MSAIADWKLVNSTGDVETKTLAPNHTYHILTGYNASTHEGTITTVTPRQPLVIYRTIVSKTYQRPVTDEDEPADVPVNPGELDTTPITITNTYPGVPPVTETMSFVNWRCQHFDHGCTYDRPLSSVQTETWISETPIWHLY